MSFERIMPDADFSDLLLPPSGAGVCLARVGNPNEQGSSYLRFSGDDLLCEVDLIPVGGSGVVKVGMTRSSSGGWGYIPVRPGDLVHVVFPGADDSMGIIVSREKAAEPNGHPSTVAGVTTAGPALATFYKGSDGEPIAVEASGELLAHAGGAGVEIKGATVNLDGTVHLGVGLATKPTPPTPGANHVNAGNAGTSSPAAQGSNPTDPAYVGPLDGIVRAKDRYQSTIGTDPIFWTFFALLDALVAALGSGNAPAIAAAYGAYNAFKLANGGLSPSTIISAAMTAARHTARD